MTPQQLLEKFYDLSVTVVGDPIIDRYIDTSVGRISPEAPVPLAKVIREYETLGGAGNVADNAYSLCNRVTLCYPRSNVNISHFLHGVDKEVVRCSDNYTVPIKTRVTCGGQQLIRIDDEDENYLTDEDRALIAKRVENTKSDLVLVSDYRKGVVNGHLLVELAQRGCKIYCNMKPDTYRELNSLIRGMRPAPKTPVVSVVFMNYKEFLDLNLIDWNWNLSPLYVVTDGKYGMTLWTEQDVDKEDRSEVRTTPVDVADATGAGDTAFTIFSLCHYLNVDLIQCAKIANAAAGVVVREHGVVPIYSNQLLAALNEGELGRAEGIPER